MRPPWGLCWMGWSRKLGNLHRICDGVAKKCEPVKKVVRWDGEGVILNAASADRCRVHMQGAQTDGTFACSQHREMHVSEVGMPEVWDFHMQPAQRSAYFRGMSVR